MYKIQIGAQSQLGFQDGSLHGYLQLLQVRIVFVSPGCIQSNFSSLFFYCYLMNT